MIAKEVRAQQIPMLVSYLSIPAFASRIKPEKLLEVALEQTDLPVERIVRSDDEAAQYEQEQMQAQARSQADALVQQLQSQGMTTEQIQQQVLALLAQLAGQTGSVAGADLGQGMEATA